MSQGWHVWQAGRTTGPFTTSELTAALLSGEIAADALVWESGAARWRSAAEQFPQLRGGKAGRKAVSSVEGGLLVASSIVFAAAFSILAAVFFTDALQTVAIAYEWFWGGVGWAALLSLAAAAPLWWRAAGRLKASGSEASGPAYIATVIVSLTAVVLTTIVLWSSRTASELIAARVSMDNYAFTYLPKEKSLAIVGSIGPRFDSRLKAQLRAQDVERIEIMSDGGLVSEAMWAARYIEHAGLTVVARGQCDSACLIILMAGKRRQADYDAVLGFHASSPLLDTARAQGAHDPDVSDEYLVRRGVPRPIVAEARRIGADHLHYVSAVDLLASGALTELLDGETPVGVDEARRRLAADAEEEDAG